MNTSSSTSRPRTVREHIAHCWPLHYQRIIELIYRDWPHDPESFLSSYCLSPHGYFVFYETPEGHRYWYNLLCRHPEAYSSLEPL